MIRRMVLTAALGLLFLGSALTLAFGQTDKDSIGTSTMFLADVTDQGARRAPAFVQNPQGIVIFEADGQYFIQLPSRGLSQMVEQRRPKPQKIVISSLSSLDAELASSIPSYVGLSTNENGEILITVADAREFDQAKQLADSKWREINNRSSDQITRAPVIMVGEAALPPVELAEAKLKLREVLNLPNVVYLALDESCGCITVGITDAAVDPHVKEFASQKGVPVNAVRTIITPRIRRFQRLDDSHRPTKGGMKIQSAAAICTLGLPVFHNTLTRKGFLTASHCTEGNSGGARGTWFAQPGGALLWADKVGVERLDPFLFDTTQDSACPTGRQCRRSDATFVEYDQGILGFVGRIARPKATCTTAGEPCDTAMSSQNSEIRVTSVVTPPVKGALLDKIGRTTGWTRGAVIVPCADTPVINPDGSDTGETMLCQLLVSAKSDHGDSGSPVFVYDAPSSTASFAGILWGGSESEDGTSLSAVSPVSALIAELGSMEFYEPATAVSSSPVLSPRQECEAACSSSNDICMAEAHIGRERGGCASEYRQCKGRCSAM
jgi:hypothetical protein